jgi:A/G-specific adenine glycosylase
MTTSAAIMTLRHDLLDWYIATGRSLPWRQHPRERSPGKAAPDPYAIWLSEIMLQQTTVPHATPYWHRFLALWPTVDALARADRDDVMREWAGLGYYARARNLHACAGIVADELGGVFPDTLDALLALPGIGDYTANAILAAAFNHPASVVDGNVERVITRMWRVQAEMPKAKPEIKRLAAKIADPDNSCDYAQAIMDLGATVCTPKSPDCQQCPWSTTCDAFAHGDMELYPRKTKKRPKPIRTGTAWLVRRADAVWLRRRADNGLLGGMMEVPSSGWADAKTDESAPFEADWAVRGEVRHIFTHFELRLDVREAEARPGWEPDEGGWSNDDALDREALPTVMRKIIALRR